MRAWFGGLGWSGEISSLSEPVEPKPFEKALFKKPGGCSWPSTLLRYTFGWPQSYKGVVWRIGVERRDLFVERASGAEAFRKAFVQEARWLQLVEQSVALYVWMAPIVPPIVPHRPNRTAPIVQLWCG